MADSTGLLDLILTIIICSIKSKCSFTNAILEIIYSHMYLSPINEFIQQKCQITERLSKSHSMKQLGNVPGQLFSSHDSTAVQNLFTAWGKTKKSLIMLQ